ncbi:MAG: DUF4867 family protein, partial [Leptospiraceae bacterium]|nr:DUF4867 family protein [Leptospiraceae bacterium]
MLEKLKQMNPGLKLHSVEEEAFLKYGKVLRGFPFEDIRDYMENVSKVPEVANVYHASIPEMESSSLYKKLSENFYGNMPIQIG